jgi:hypothetical protein
MTTTDSQRAQRIAQVWTREPDLSEEEVHQIVEADLQREAAERVEADAKSRELTASFEQMTACGCCHAVSAFGSRDGLCPDCRPIIGLVRAEHRATELVGDVTRRELAERYLDRQEKGA